MLVTVGSMRVDFPSDNQAALNWEAGADRSLVVVQQPRDQLAGDVPLTAVHLSGARGSSESDVLMTFSSTIRRPGDQAREGLPVRFATENPSDCWVHVQPESMSPQEAAEIGNDPSIRVATSDRLTVHADYTSVYVDQSFKGAVRWTAGRRGYGDFSRLGNEADLWIRATDYAAASASGFVAPSGKAHSITELFHGVERLFDERPTTVVLRRQAGTDQLVVFEAEFAPRFEHHDVRLWAPEGMGDSEWSEDDAELDLIKDGPQPFDLEDVSPPLSRIALNRSMRGPEIGGPAPLAQAF